MVGVHHRKMQAFDWLAHENNFKTTHKLQDAKFKEPPGCIERRLRCARAIMRALCDVVALYTCANRMLHS